MSKDPVMKAIKNLSREQLEDFCHEVVTQLYYNANEAAWDRDKEWYSETIEWVANAIPQTVRDAVGPTDDPE